VNGKHNVLSLKQAWGGCMVNHPYIVHCE